MSHEQMTEQINVCMLKKMHILIFRRVKGVIKITSSSISIQGHIEAEYKLDSVCCFSQLEKIIIQM